MKKKREKKKRKKKLEETVKRIVLSKSSYEASVRDCTFFLHGNYEGQDVRSFYMSTMT